MRATPAAFRLKPEATLSSHVGFPSTGCSLYWVLPSTGCSPLLGAPLYWVLPSTGCSPLLGAPLYGVWLPALAGRLREALDLLEHPVVFADLEQLLYRVPGR